MTASGLWDGGWGARVGFEDGASTTLYFKKVFNFETALCHRIAVENILAIAFSLICNRNVVGKLVFFKKKLYFSKRICNHKAVTNIIF